MKQQCGNCHYFYLYYTKGYDKFNKTRCGTCNKHNKDVKEAYFCEFWKDFEKKIESRKKVSLQTLEICVNYIHDIAQILKESQEEEMTLKELRK